MSRTIAITFTLLCAAAALAQPEPRARVRVTFAIDAPAIRRDLGPELSGTLADGAKAMRAQLDKQFPYLAWVTEGEAEHRLTATLKQRPASGDLETILEYSGSISAGAAPVRVLYPWFLPPPVDALPLRNSLREKIIDDVRKSHAELKSFFASQVPVIKRVEVNETLQRIVLPVADIAADSGSRFIVDFKDQRETPGTIRLYDVKPYSTKGLLCTIEVFDLAPLRAAWHPSISGIMRTRARDVRVRVEEFVPRAFTNTQGGSVTELQPR